MRFAFYVSGHGFGHATRLIAVMEALRGKCPGAEFHVRTLAPRQVLEDYARGPFEHTAVQLDAGAIERDILTVDVEATVQAVLELHSRRAQILSAEEAFLRAYSPAAIVFDLPPIAARLGHAAGIPAFGVGNFSWDFIYGHFRDGRLDGVIKCMREDYSQCTNLFRLPFHHDMTAFPRQEAVPLVAAVSTADRKFVRRELGLGESDVAVLVALRGEAVPGLAESAATDNIVRLLMFGGAEGPGRLVIPAKWQRRFVDLLAASEVVLGKPGYGVVSECVANRKPLLHLPREGFAETPFLLAGMDGLIPHEVITSAEIAAGHLAERASKLAAREFQHQQVRCDGADVIATRILELLR